MAISQNWSRMNKRQSMLDQALMYTRPDRELERLLLIGAARERHEVAQAEAAARKLREERQER